MLHCVRLGARLDLSAPASRRSRNRCPRTGSGGQTNPSQTKPSQIKPSKSAWFNLVLFVRIETFQWVTANPNKNSVSPVTLWLNCHKPVLPSVSSAPAFPKAGFIRRLTRYSTEFWFFQANACFSDSHARSGDLVGAGRALGDGQTQGLRPGPYLFSASSTLTEARPLTSRPAFCSKSAIAALLLVPTCPSGSPPMS